MVHQFDLNLEEGKHFRKDNVNLVTHPKSANND